MASIDETDAAMVRSRASNKLPTMNAWVRTKFARLMAVDLCSAETSGCTKVLGQIREKVENV